MQWIKLSHPTRCLRAEIELPGSKSESNRWLILNRLLGGKLNLQRLSAADDTQRLMRLLQSDALIADVEDTGTSMRFLTAMYAALNTHKIITGNARMRERPVRHLVDALCRLGFDVRYREKEGYPPVEIIPIENFNNIKSEVEIAGDVSSQFISALLLIAPFLPRGLKIHFTTSLRSRPYVEMTISILRQLGVDAALTHDTCYAMPLQNIATSHISIGADWSSASYWYSMVFLADDAEISLLGLCDDWRQGDRIIVEWMERFGCETTFSHDGVTLRKRNVQYPRMMKYNFADNPDLVQTFAAMLGAKGVITSFSGIDNLRLKETDRITALQRELQKFNLQFEYASMFDFYQLRGNYQPANLPVKTYGDHRMAMAFAPLALLHPITIENPAVVNKSYPAFWTHLISAGFEVVEAEEC
ncbi:MAG: hypothetical protein NZM35_00875 [Chitinophagales bacterium]|nr:hypothetical protein [Chitinophagales bacterium]MDW8418978.1 hypothetical protein [Chitinophagales bacterium]